MFSPCGLPGSSSVARFPWRNGPRFPWCPWPSWAPAGWCRRRRNICHLGWIWRPSCLLGYQSSKRPNNQPLIVYGFVDGLVDFQIRLKTSNQQPNNNQNRNFLKKKDCHILPPKFAQKNTVREREDQHLGRILEPREGQWHPRLYQNDAGVKVVVHPMISAKETWKKERPWKTMAEAITHPRMRYLYNYNYL